MTSEVTGVFTIFCTSEVPPLSSKETGCGSGRDAGQGCKFTAATVQSVAESANFSCFAKLLPMGRGPTAAGYLYFPLPGCFNHNFCGQNCSACYQMRFCGWFGKQP